MLVFCKSKERAIEVYDWLYGIGFNADVLHGDMSQQKRDQLWKASVGPRPRSLWQAILAARGP